jgi:hypothetical protein
MAKHQQKIITLHDSDDLLPSKIEHDDVLFQAQQDKRLRLLEDALRMKEQQL